MPHDIMNSKSLCSRLDLLFSEQHLKLDSEFFGVRDPTAARKEKIPLQQQFNATLSSSLPPSMKKKKSKVKYPSS
jgi:hypothetical protein